jgi:two-component sensor histidine kinase/Tfp pilus assembly protein PilF
MRFLNKILIIFILIIININYSTIFAQKTKQDSLYKLLQHKKLVDTSKVELFLQLSLTYKKKNYTDAIIYADSAYVISKKINWEKGKMLYWIAYGDISKENSYTSNAIKFYKYAISIAEENKFDDYIPLVYNKIGVILRKTDNYPEAIKYHLEAIKTAEKYKNYESELYAINGIGNCYFMLNNLNEAEIYFTKALKLAEKQSNKKSLAINYNNLGEVLSRKNEFEKAEKYLAKSLKLNLDLNDNDGIAICNSSLGNLFYNQELFYQSLHYYIKSLNIEIKLKNDIQIAQSYINLGKTYIKLENYKLAEECLVKGLNISQKIDSKSNKKDAYFYFKELYNLKKDYKTSLSYLEKYIVIKDSLANVEIQTNVMSIQVEHDINQQKSKVAMLEQEKKYRKQKNIKNSFLTIVGIISLFGLIITLIYYRRNKERKKVNIELSKLLAEKEILIAEIHHRVKNNLAIISGLLELQSQKFQNKEIVDALTDTKLRIHTFSKIHETAYHIEKHSLINFEEFIKEYAENFYFLKNNNNIELQISAEKTKLNLNTAVSLGLIFNEILSNAVKHAFPNFGKGIIKVELFHENEIIFLKVDDNGIGLQEIPKLEDSHTPGLMIVSIYAKQIKAKILIENKKGTSYTISFIPSKMKTW